MGVVKETVFAEFLAFFSEKIERKYVWRGSCEYLKTMKVRDEKKLTSNSEQEVSPVCVEQAGDG